MHSQTKISSFDTQQKVGKSKLDKTQNQNLLYKESPNSRMKKKKKPHTISQPAVLLMPLWYQMLSVTTKPPLLLFLPWNLTSKVLRMAWPKKKNPS